MQKVKEFLSDELFLNSSIYIDLKQNYQLSDVSIRLLRQMLAHTINERPKMRFQDIAKSCFGEINSAELVGYLDDFASLLKKEFISVADIRVPNLDPFKSSGVMLMVNVSLSRFGLKYFGLAGDDRYQVERMSEDDFIKFKNKPYEDISELLDDMFNYIEARANGQLAIAKLRNEMIASRIKTSNISSPFEQIAAEYELSNTELLMIILLAREEFTGAKRPIPFGELLKIAGASQLERIKNYKYLDDSSVLLKEGLVEYVGNDNNLVLGVAALRYFKDKQNSVKDAVEDMGFFEYVDIKDEKLVLNQELEELAGILKKRKSKSAMKRMQNWGFDAQESTRANIIFYGPPGTGKTASASYIAKVLDADLITLDCSRVLDKYVGESEKNVRAIFDNYKHIVKVSGKTPILLLNEADQFLSARSAASSGSELMHNQMQNIFLEQLERFDGILIATTNFLDNLDAAFARRFDTKIEFKNPTQEERIKIWKLHLPKNAAYEDEFKPEDLSSYELSGAQIRQAVKNAAIKAACSDGIIRKKVLVEYIDKELNGGFFKEIKVGFN